MTDLLEPLTESEIDRMDRCLRERIDEAADTTGKDEGVCCISQLDGLFTAIVSGPVTVAPSVWLSAVWGDFEPVWQTKQEQDSILALIMRHMNHIGATLMEQPEAFEPRFLVREVGDKTHTVVDKWCKGYRRGMQLAPNQWAGGGEEVDELLVPILALAEGASSRGHNGVDNEVDALLQASIAPNVLAIHAYWLLRREDQAAP